MFLQVYPTFPERGTATSIKLENILERLEYVEEVLRVHIRHEDPQTTLTYHLIADHGALS